MAHEEAGKEGIDVEATAAARAADEGAGAFKAEAAGHHPLAAAVGAFER